MSVDVLYEQIMRPGVNLHCFHSNLHDKVHTISAPVDVPIMAMPLAGHGVSRGPR